VPNALSANDALAILGAALNHIRAAGLKVITHNDSGAGCTTGALVVKIIGAEQVQTPEGIRFAAREVQADAMATPTTPTA
jgi:hypothetical protein